MASDQTIKVAVATTGKNVDVSEVTRDDGTVAERQRANISDPCNLDAHARVLGATGDGKLATVDEQLLAEVKALRRSTEEFILKLTIALKLN